MHTEEESNEQVYQVTADEIATIPMEMLRLFEADANTNPWRTLDETREAATKIRTWPDYLFADAYTIFDASAKAISVRHPNHQQQYLKGVTLSVFGPWRITRGVYCFDSELSNALSDTDAAAEVPVEILYRLPEWAVCIFGPGLSLDENVVCAFAALANTEADPDKIYLRIITVYADRMVDLTNILLTPGITVEQSVLSAIKAPHDSDMKEFAEPLSEQDRIIRNISSIIAHLLYLCADEPDMTTTPPRPQPKKTKTGLRFFPPTDGSRVVSVGARFGAIFRRTRAEFADAQKHAKTGRTLPPHWRKAHWHSFLTGPRKSGQQKKIVKWIAPTFVNATSEDIAVVVRPVL